MSLYENITICNMNNRFPIEVANLVMGQIYMGTDMLLYVGTGGLPQPCGMTLYAIGIGHDHYVDSYVDSMPEDESITFRLCNVNIAVS